ncbi:hypothetical protein FACS1894174_02930 [Bacteroidia bacterium]|nr:hypothetical protein FACS1894203_3370 [Bacteroidia bacterium]GHV20654.1 hypothetical protein FACS1894174_02930 [Bacteroidia bacterium]
MKKALLSCIIIFFSFLSINAQEGNTVFNFLSYPASARASALGRTNVSIIENDVSLIYHNPAFLGPEMNMNVNLNYLFYIADIGMGSATFAKAMGERSAWGIGFNYVDYGKMIGADKDGNISGDLPAKDICGNLFFSHDITDKLRGGITAKFVYSPYDQYTSIGLGVDLGLSYYNKDHRFSVGLVGKNLGRQIKAYNEELTEMPWEIQFGISKRLEHAPIRFSLTTINLNRWNYKNINGDDQKFFTTLLDHFILGLDFLPSDNLWIALGYNTRLGSDMKLQQGNRMAGFSIGAGLNIKAFKIGCSLAQYHPSATSFMVSLTTSLSEVKL